MNGRFYKNSPCGLRESIYHDQCDSREEELCLADDVLKDIILVIDELVRIHAMPYVSAGTENRMTRLIELVKSKTMKRQTKAQAVAAMTKAFQKFGKEELVPALANVVDQLNSSAIKLAKVTTQRNEAEELLLGFVKAFAPAEGTETMIKTYAVKDEHDGRIAVFVMLVDAENCAKQWRETNPNAIVEIVPMVEQSALMHVKEILTKANTRLIQLEAMIERLVDNYKEITSG